MLDKTRPSRPNFETAFKRWWDGQPTSYRNRIDASAARISFRAGYATGRNADLDRYVFTAGRLRITVWGSGMLDAKRKALAEAEFRAAKNGWPTPKGGWVLKELR
ncbi:hypothetical protein ELH93_28625 (plasmid) [Rhizobium leguminosarum]|uniref:hypothetical protein n=1 Tax=Rhizobium leguminosarum TaxID=384 RepID=UPI001031BB71|nr:hypothetical protein [Rhizobium leguminosarum]TAY27694.1 hypothetical protein ELH93_28625 [Rhizobium leguminosarum]